MDPTKPILDLYGDSMYSIPQREPKSHTAHYKSPTYNQQRFANNYANTTSNKNYTSPNYQNRRTRGQGGFHELQEKYQELYSAYKEKSQALSYIQNENDQLRNQNTRLRDQIDRLNNKNNELNSTLLSKNMELQEAYRKLQDEMRNGGGIPGGSRVGRGSGDQAIDRLQDGLKQAITSNFQILRESALSELKHFMH